MVSWSGCLADPSSVSIVIPALNEEDAIGDVVSSLRAEAAWREILVVDDGSRDATGERAARAGALVVRHPYTKGNGAAVKTGIRRAEGQFILILDADGQHAPSDARRLVERLGEYDLVVGARSTQTQATVGAADRQSAAQSPGELSHRTARSRSDVRISRRAARAPARVPASAAQRILHADDDDAGVHQGGLQRHLRASRCARAHRSVEDQVRAETARGSF